MKKKAFLLLAAALLMLCSCHKPDGGKDNPAPSGSEITTNNAAPGGFSDEGPVSWDE